MLTPPKSTSGLPGRRMEAKRAGMRPRTIRIGRRSRSNSEKRGSKNARAGQFGAAPTPRQPGAELLSLDRALVLNWVRFPWVELFNAAGGQLPAGFCVIL